VPWPRRRISSTRSRCRLPTGSSITSFATALTWPETLQRIQALLARGLQRDVDFEKRWPEVLGTLVET
jgi:hypothetical protein